MAGTNETSGVDDKTLLSHKTLNTESTRSSSRCDRSFGFKILTLAQLNDLPEEDEEYLVEGLLPTGGSSILYAKPKKGKSSIARQLAVNVAQGTTFLGRDCAPGPVLYFALEEKLQEVKTHFELLGAHGTEQIMVVSSVEGDARLEVHQAITALQPSLVIIDTVPKFLRIPKMNDYSVVNEALRWLHETARATGTHILGVMHAKKGQEEDVMDGLLGSTAFAGGVDTLIALTETPRGRTISSVQRYGIPIEEALVHFDPQTRSISLGLATSLAVSEDKRLARAELAGRIVGFVTGNPGCLEADILGSVVGSGKSLRETLRFLLDSAMRREGTGKSGDPYRYYGDVPVEA